MRHAALPLALALAACSGETPVDTAGYAEYTKAGECYRAAMVAEWASRHDPDLADEQAPAKVALEAARNRHYAAAKRLGMSERAIADDTPSLSNDDFGREVAGGNYLNVQAGCPKP